MDLKFLKTGRVCCDPFGIHKNIIRKDIRVVSRNLIHRNPELNLTADHKVCSMCRKLLAVAETRVSTNILMHHFDQLEVEKKTRKNALESEYQISDQYFIGHCTAQHPKSKKKLSKNPNYAKKKFKKVKFTMKKKFEVATMQSLSSSDFSETQVEIVEQLKKKFNEVMSKSEKLKILTILQKSGSRQKIINEFHCSEYMTRHAKSLVREKAVLSTSNPQFGKLLHSEIAAKVVDFYHSLDVSRQMPGLINYVSVKGADGSRERKQKFVILFNLKEPYQNFKEKHPTMKIGFSKFTEFSPKECVLPGLSGTHCVCVYTKHQNVKLIISAMKFPSSPWTSTLLYKYIHQLLMNLLLLVMYY